MSRDWSSFQYKTKLKKKFESDFTSEKISSDGLLETTPSDLLRAIGSQVSNVDLRPWLGELCCEAAFKFLSATTLRSDASLLNSKFKKKIKALFYWPICLSFDTLLIWLHLGGTLISLLLCDFGYKLRKM